MPPPFIFFLPNEYDFDVVDRNPEAFFVFYFLKILATFKHIKYTQYVIVA